MPYGADGMNDIASWKTIRAGNTGFSREATAEQPTLTEQFQSRRPVDGSVNASAADQSCVAALTIALTRSFLMSSRRDSIFKAVETCFV